MTVETPRLCAEGLLAALSFINTGRLDAGAQGAGDHRGQVLQGQNGS